MKFNPLVTNGLSHFYHFDESTFIFRGFRSKISFFDDFPVSKQNSLRWDAAFVASQLGLYCLPVSHKKDGRLIFASF